MLGNDSLVNVVRSLTRVWLSVAPRTSCTPGSSALHCLPEFAQTTVHVPFCLQSFPASGSFPVIQVFESGGQLLELQLQKQSFQRIFRVYFLKDWLVWSPCSSRDSQGSSLAPQFKSINSLVLSFLYGPSLTSIHDYWKNHSFDYVDLCWQSDVSTFKYTVCVSHSLPSKEQVSFDFVTAVTICSDFGAQNNKVCHCFHCFPIYLPWSDGTRCHDLSFLNVEF